MFGSGQCIRPSVNLWFEGVGVFTKDIGNPRKIFLLRSFSPLALTAKYHRFQDNAKIWFYFWQQTNPWFTNSHFLNCLKMQQ